MRLPCSSNVLLLHLTWNFILICLVLFFLVLIHKIFGVSSTSTILSTQGNIAFKEKQWQKAINFYSEAIKLCGKNATYYSNRAAAYLEQGR